MKKDKTSFYYAVFLSKYNHNYYFFFAGYSTFLTSPNDKLVTMVTIDVKDEVFPDPPTTFTKVQSQPLKKLVSLVQLQRVNPVQYTFSSLRKMSLIERAKIAEQAERYDDMAMVSRINVDLHQ